MRNRGDDIILSRSLFKEISKQHPYKSKERIWGFVLDKIEKDFFEKDGWVISDQYAPYDIEKDGVKDDFKLVSIKTVTFSNSEKIFGFRDENYRIRLYGFFDDNSEDDPVATYLGVFKFQDIKERIREGKPNDSGEPTWYALLLDVDDHLQ